MLAAHADKKRWSENSLGHVVASEAKQSPTPISRGTACRRARPRLKPPLGATP